MNNSEIAENCYQERAKIYSTSERLTTMNAVHALRQAVLRSRCENHSSANLRLPTVTTHTWACRYQIDLHCEKSILKQLTRDIAFSSKNN